MRSRMPSKPRSVSTDLENTDKQGNSTFQVGSAKLVKCGALGALRYKGRLSATH
jgi:hypothetical protein